MKNSLSEVGCISLSKLDAKKWAKERENKKKSIYGKVYQFKCTIVPISIEEYAKSSALLQGGSINRQKKHELEVIGSCRRYDIRKAYRVKVEKVKIN